VKGEYLDPRLRRVENTLVVVTARHLALQAVGALARINVQRLLHQRLPPFEHFFVEVCQPKPSQAFSRTEGKDSDWRL
jgi:hypothetical protein